MSEKQWLSYFELMARANLAQMRAFALEARAYKASGELGHFQTWLNFAKSSRDRAKVYFKEAK